jgi:hypothetical protein
MTSVTSSDAFTPDGRRLPTRVSKACERCRRHKSRVSASSSSLFTFLYTLLSCIPTEQQISVIHSVRAHFVFERMLNVHPVAATCPLAVARRKGNAHGKIHTMILSVLIKGLSAMQLVRLRLCSVRMSDTLCIPMTAFRLPEKWRFQWTQRADGRV